MCKKDVNEAPGTAVQTDAYYPVARIQGFIDRAAHPEIRSNEEMTKEDAEWLVEAALNYGTIDPNAKFDELRVDSPSVWLDLVDGKVPEADAYNAYNTLTDALTSAGLEEDEKTMVIDVIATVDGEQVKLQAYRLAGKETGGTLSLAPPNTNYTQNYRCRPNAVNLLSCTNVTSTADVQIKNRINQGIGILQCCLTDIQTWTVSKHIVQGGFVGPEITAVDLVNRRIPSFLYPNPSQDPNNRNDDHKVFTTAWCNWLDYDCEPCINPATMSFLTQGTYDVMLAVKTTYIPNPNMQPIGCRVTGLRGQRQGSGNLPEYDFFHNAEFIYGRWYPMLDPG